MEALSILCSLTNVILRLIDNKAQNIVLKPYVAMLEVIPSINSQTDMLVQSAICLCQNEIIDRNPWNLIHYGCGGYLMQVDPTPGLCDMFTMIKILLSQLHDQGQQIAHLQQLVPHPIVSPIAMSHEEEPLATDMFRPMMEVVLQQHGIVLPPPVDDFPPLPSQPKPQPTLNSPSLAPVIDRPTETVAVSPPKKMTNMKTPTVVHASMPKRTAFSRFISSLNSKSLELNVRVKPTDLEAITIRAQAWSNTQLDSHIRAINSVHATGPNAATTFATLVGTFVNTN